MKITLKQLEVFIAIARSESVSHAAKKVCLTQSACSMALKVLEKQLNTILFDRHDKQLTLNEHGRFLLIKAENIIAQVKEFQTLSLEKSENTLHGHLIVGASSTIGNYILPKIISEFIALFPHIKFTVRVSNTEKVIEQVRKFEIDIGLIEGECLAEEIEVQRWMIDELVIIASPGYPLKRKQPLKLKDLLNNPWILRESGSGTRQQFEKAVGKKISPFMEFSHTEAIKKAVQAGLGLSCLSKVTVADELQNKNLLELKSPSLNLNRHFYVLVHRNKYKTVILTEFLNSLLNSANRLDK